MGVMDMWYVFFFFQAEDGIRDATVTGVQTCALPISDAHIPGRGEMAGRARPGLRRVGDYPAGVCGAKGLGRHVLHPGGVRLSPGSSTRRAVCLLLSLSRTRWQVRSHPHL